MQRLGFNQKNLRVEVHVASSFKSKDFFIEAFKAYPKAEWIFGIDGLPEESHTYRVNQDGKKLYEIMLEARNHLFYRPTWQYIIFSYNEDHVDLALEMAKKDNLTFLIINSSRWIDKGDWLKPNTRR